jgi:hypothetical protein
VGTLDQAHDQGVIIGIAAERAGMTLTDRNNPSVTELAWEARQRKKPPGPTSRGASFVVRKSVTRRPSPQRA